MAGVLDANGDEVPGILTECTGEDDGWENTFRWDAINLVVDAAHAGSIGLYMWNLALDPSNGPRNGGHCPKCRGMLKVDPARGTATPEAEFYTFGHVARAADPGAVRIGITSSEGIPAVAFSNADGTIGVFGHNDTGSTQVLSIGMLGRHEKRLEVGCGELFTFRSPPVIPGR